MNRREQDIQQIRGHFFTSATYTPWTWIFYGDSVTQGSVHTGGWRSFSEIFAERVRGELQRRMDRVINTGISGQTTRELTDPKQYEWRVRSLNPNVVLIMVGLNDIVELDSVELFRCNLAGLVDMIRRDGAIPVLQTSGTIRSVPQNPGYLKRWQELPCYMAAVRHTAEEQDTILINHYAHWEKNAAAPEVLASWLGEAIHPGARGHLEMAKEIFKIFHIYDRDCPCCNPGFTYNRKDEIK